MKRGVASLGEWLTSVLMSVPRRMRDLAYRISSILGLGAVVPKQGGALISTCEGVADQVVSERLPK